MVFCNRALGGWPDFLFCLCQLYQQRRQNVHGSLKKIRKRLKSLDEKNELKNQFRIFEGYDQCSDSAFLREASSQLANRKWIVAREIGSGKDKSLQQLTSQFERKKMPPESFRQENTGGIFSLESAIIYPTG